MQRDTKALAVQQQAALEPVSTLSIIQMAVQQGAGIDTIERLVALKEREDAAIARREFNESFGAFKAEAVRVVKNATVSDGPLKGKKYADLAGVVLALTEKLAKHGLAASWRLTKDEPTWMEVTCTLRHRAGHSESVSMAGAPDTGPGRNAIQARASAVNYLERYTLLAVTGMAAEGQDNDGGGGRGGTLNDEAYIAHLDNIQNASNPAELKRVFELAYKAANDAKDTAARDAFVKAKDNRKLELAR